MLDQWMSDFYKLAEQFSSFVIDHLEEEEIFAELEKVHDDPDVQILIGFLKESEAQRHDIGN